jgi:hypothetical protein
MSTFSTPLSPGPIEHDPSGSDVQVHEVGDEVYLTFSDSFLEKSGWQEGDVIVWDLDGDSVKIANPRADVRKALREKVEELLRGGPEL